MSAKIELLLHPVRMRIMQLFVTNKELTAGQVIQLIPEVPQASLYRHLAKLVQANVIEVATENRIRGTVEKTYRLIQADTLHQDIRQMTPKEHEEVFFAFIAHLLAEFSDYVHKENMDFYEDGVSYRQASVYLDDEEYKDLLQSFKELVGKAIKKRPRSGRRLRTIATIIIPK